MAETAGAAIVVPGEGAPVELSAEERQGLEEEQKLARAEMFKRLDALGESLASTRSEAIQARQNSGIEEDWQEDEEYYEGVDDLNRSASRTNWRTKPPGKATAVKPGQTRCTAFFNITGPYVDAAAARIADMLLPTDDRAWALKPTPVPDLIGASKGQYSPQMMREAAAIYPGQPGLAKQKLAQATEQALKIIDEAKGKADRAQTRIEDWHVESQWHAEVRSVIEDAARIGTGILKGPIPIQKTTLVVTEGGLEQVKVIKPGSRRIDPWNFFPAAGCGENIHNGACTWECDFLTRRQLRDLLGQPDYLDEQIEACLEEGPQEVTAEYVKEVRAAPTDPTKRDSFQIWYFHGTVEREDLEAFGCDCEGQEDPHVPAIVTMVNNRVIKAVLNPLDTGEFPYDVMVWRKRAGTWTGTGVARQIRTPQEVVNAGGRNLMDNAGIAAGPMIIFKPGVISPADGVLGFAPRKVFIAGADANEMAKAEDAIGTVKIDMVVDELLEIIQFGLKMAEDVTGLPMLLQGQQGKAPDTVGGMQLLNNNASAVLRRLARLFDDRITEPHVRRYYHWLLQYGEDEEKGDYCIDARGSSALVERDIQNQELAQLGAIIVNPVFKKDPVKWIDEYLKSRHLDPKRFEYDDEQWQQIVENMAKGPQDPRMAVAQLQAQLQERLKTMDGQIKAQLQALEQQWESGENAMNRQLEFVLGEMKTLGIDPLRIEEIRGKVKLADTVIKTNTQKQLAAVPVRPARQGSSPPTEPPGRAPKGQAYQR